MTTTERKGGRELYAKLPEYACDRRDELTAMFQPVLEVTAEYGALLSEVVFVLGNNPPQSVHQEVVRDLIADVFDFLYEWQRSLMEGRLNVAFPLGRRAYEALSLLSVCIQDSATAVKWANGKRFGNAEIRNSLGLLPHGEREDDLRSLYDFFSEGSHPNRSLVAKRYLGDGNQFVLGSIGRPDLALATIHCIHLLQMWFWYAANSIYSSKELVTAHRADFGADYLATAARAKERIAWLEQQYPRLLAEEKAMLSACKQPSSAEE